jgi:glycosyltransferase involved in cell wall biosynthesis
MRIAQVSPLYESCPPQLYGGTERVVSYLTEELVRQGHEVTLFASGDSQTNGILKAPCDRALRLSPKCKDPLVYHFISLNRVARSANDFDIIHFHTDYLHFPLFAQRCGKTLTTMHGRLDLPDLPPMLREFAVMPLVSISKAQRAPVPWANWFSTVYHGLPTRLYAAGSGDGGYLAFIGRICPEKRPDWAIEIARRAGLPLAIVAKVDRADRSYYRTRIKPLLKDPMIEFIGEIGDSDKGAFLGDAMALLFPIDWPEPFGLVLIEAMANGTPVIAFGRGSVPEIIDHGVTGFIVDSVDEAVAAIPLAKTLDRRAIRRRFEERFSVERMARDYVMLYSEILRRGPVDAVLNSAATAHAMANAA